jgi:DNA-binding response OmpR family regulator
MSARILVVDDDNAHLELVTYFLKAQGYHVVAVPDGNRALNMTIGGDFELVILDSHLPTYTGVEVLHLLRKRHVLRPIKVLALTADTSFETRDALESGGIDGFLTKPVDLAALRAEVHRLVAGESQRALGLYARRLQVQLHDRK